MNKFINILCLTFVLSVAVFAQTNTDEYKKNEYYVGYSNQQLDSGDYRTANGFEGSYVRNVHRYFGIKADVSGAYRTDTFDFSAFTDTNTPYSVRQKTNRSIYNFLGGVQVKNNASQKRFKPFAHALAGVAVTRQKYRTSCLSGDCPSFYTTNPTFNFNGTHFSAALGGGLDIKINDKIDFRAIQVDYNPIFRGGGFWEHNVRFGVGIVFK